MKIPSSSSSTKIRSLHRILRFSRCDVQLLPIVFIHPTTDNPSQLKGLTDNIDGFPSAGADGFPPCQSKTDRAEIRLLMHTFVLWRRNAFNQFQIRDSLGRVVNLLATCLWRIVWVRMFLFDARTTAVLPTGRKFYCTP